MSTYCSRFVKGYATITQPPCELTQKDTPWQWTTRHDHALAWLKAWVTHLLRPTLTLTERHRSTSTPAQLALEEYWHKRILQQVMGKSLLRRAERCQKWTADTARQNEKHLQSVGDVSIFISISTENRQQWLLTSSPWLLSSMTQCPNHLHALKGRLSDSNLSWHHLQAFKKG